MQRNARRGRTNFRGLLSEIKRAATEDRITTGGAALAYYLTLAIFPALILLFSVVPYLPIANVDQAALELLRQTLPADAAGLLSDTVRDIATTKRGGLLSLGALGLLWAASGGALALMQELNHMIGVRETRSFLKLRVRALGLTLFSGSLMILGFSLVILGGEIQSWIAQRVGGRNIVSAAFKMLRWILILASLSAAIAGLYRFGPNLKSRFRPLSPGGIVAVITIVGASLLFRLYVSSFGNYQATYGAIGGAIILMLWLYATGVALLLGAETDDVIRRSKEKSPSGRPGIRLVAGA